MTKEEFEKGLEQAAKIQRAAGWSEYSIQMYRKEQEAITGDKYAGVLLVGAGLACDNSRFGVKG